MRYYSNTSVETTLTLDISAVSTSIQLGDTTGLPVTYPYTLVIDYEGTAVEVVTVTSSAGASLLVTRGQDGTSAQSHTAGARVVHAATARDFAEPQTHIADSQDVHGIGADSFVVGTETAQTLINKDLDGSQNSFSNIPPPAISGDGALSLEGNSGADPMLFIDGEPGNGEPGIVVVADAEGVIITRETGGTGDLLQINDDGPTTVFRVQDTGETDMGTANVDGDLSVTGASDFTGAVTTAAGVASTRGAAGDDAFTAKVSGDSEVRLAVDADGKLNWGSGSLAADTNLFRQAANVLRTDDALQVGGGLGVTGSITATTSISATTAVSAATTVSAGSTITAGTGLTVTTGNITVSSGNVNVTGAGTFSGNVTAADFLIDAATDISLKTPVNLTGTNVLTAATGWSTSFAEAWVFGGKVVFLNAVMQRTGAAISSGAGTPGITDSQMATVVSALWPSNRNVHCIVTVGANFPAVMRINTADGGAFLEAFSAGSLTLNTNDLVPFNVCYVLT